LYVTHYDDMTLMLILSLQTMIRSGTVIDSYRRSDRSRSTPTATDIHLVERRIPSRWYSRSHSTAMALHILPSVHSPELA
jgi:hypothetical protein